MRKEFRHIPGMKTMRRSLGISLLGCLAVVFTVLSVCSCDKGDNYVYIENDIINNGGLKGSYEGQWSVDGQQGQVSEVTVYDTGFSFRTLPVKAVLETLLPDHDVRVEKNVGYMVPYEMTGYSEKASYYAVRPQQWTVSVSVDGKEYDAVFHFMGYEDGYIYGSVATYSRLSGVYKIVLRLRGIELYDGDVRAYAVDKMLKLTYVTRKRI